MIPRRVAFLLTIVTTGLVSGAAGAAVSPAKLQLSILRSATAQRSVHYVSDQTAGTKELTMVGDAGRTQGIQRITFRKDGITGHVTVIVAGQTAYIRGDAFTLTNFMGFKPSIARTYANRWIRIPYSNHAYATVAAGVTLASTISELKMPARRLSRIRPTTVAHQHVVGVHGNFVDPSGVSVSQTLYARAAGAPLPVFETAKRGSYRFTVTLSRWNETVRVHTPSAAVSITKLVSGPTA